jgi:hypothetical protein
MGEMNKHTSKITILYYVTPINYDRISLRIGLNPLPSCWGLKNLTIVKFLPKKYSITSQKKTVLMCSMVPLSHIT